MPRFVKALAFLVEAHGEKHMSAPRVDAYFKALQDFPIQLVERGMEHALQNVPRFPRPAEIRKAICDRRPMRRQPALPAPEAVSTPAHGKVAFALVQEILRTKMPPAQRRERFAQMARDWPGIGWEDAEIVAAMQAESES
jgi:hypothetical protein